MIEKKFESFMSEWIQTKERFIKEKKKQVDEIMYEILDDYQLDNSRDVVKFIDDGDNTIQITYTNIEIPYGEISGLIGKFKLIFENIESEFGCCTSVYSYLKDDEGRKYEVPRYGDDLTLESGLEIWINRNYNTDRDDWGKRYKSIEMTIKIESFDE
jgi:hypothetical protein